MDKDLASALLAIDLRADALVILTDVDKVRLDFDGPNERPIDQMTVAEARRFQAAGEFPPGSMGPKIEALCRFVDATGGTGVVTSIDNCEYALDAETGTRVVK